MRMLATLLLTLVLSVAAFGAQAEGFAIGARTSLYTVFPGYGVEATLGLSPKFNLRLAKDVGSLATSVSASGDPVNASLNTDATSGFVDWHVFSGNFRVTGGYVLDGNNGTFSGTGTYAGVSTTIGGNINMPGSSPYIGIGFGNAVKKNRGLGFSADVGVLLQGTPNVTITNQGILTNPQKAQVESDMQNTLNQLTVLPVFSFGVSYQF